MLVCYCWNNILQDVSIITFFCMFYWRIWFSKIQTKCINWIRIWFDNMYREQFCKFNELAWYWVNSGIVLYKTKIVTGKYLKPLNQTFLRGTNMPNLRFLTLNVIDCRINVWTKRLKWHPLFPQKRESTLRQTWHVRVGTQHMKHSDWSKWRFSIWRYVMSTLSRTKCHFKWND